MILVRKILQNLNRKGWRKIRRRIDKYSLNRRYRRWLRCVEENPAAHRRTLSAQVALLPRRPLISIILPVYNVEEKWLRKCLDSVQNQIYENWQLCIADDCSPSSHVKKVLDEYAALDNRIKVVYRTVNGHISAASNSALEMADGDFCALLDHDDELAEDALFRVVEEINRFPEAELIYSDEDMIDARGRRYEPKFKPDWSRDLFYSLNLITHLAVYRTATLRLIGGWQTGCEGSQDYDLTLRVIERIPESQIRHIPRILYHWRAISGSVALDSEEKPYAHERAREAIRLHLERTGGQATVSQTVYNLHRVRYDLPPHLPKVNLILLGNENLAATVQAAEVIVENTDYRNLEVILVGSPPAEADLNRLPNEKLKIVFSKAASEAEKYNCAALRSDGEIICFVNENLRPASKEWLKEMVGFALQPKIGAAGAKIVSADGIIRHGGIILGGGNLIGYAHAGLADEIAGNFERSQIVNNFSAVTIDCLVTRRAVFQMLEGFDADKLPNKFFDVDFCLTLWEKKLRVVWTPYARLVQVDEKNSLHIDKPPTASERDFFKQKWRGLIERDPFYNPNFSFGRTSFTVKVK